MIVTKNKMFDELGNTIETLNSEHREFIYYAHSKKEAIKVSKLFHCKAISVKKPNVVYYNGERINEK